MLRLAACSLLSASARAYLIRPLPAVTAFASAVMLSTPASAAPGGMHALKGTSMSGTEVSYNSFSGKPILMVNVASQWGATKRVYAQLHEWNLAYGDKLQILLFPSDEFGGQELPSEKVPAFVKGQGLPTDGGGVTLMAKVKTNGPSADPAYLLAKAAFPGDIGWNFGALFLFDGAGAPLARYGGRDLAQVGAEIERQIAACAA